MHHVHGSITPTHVSHTRHSMTQPSPHCSFGLIISLTQTNKQTQTPHCQSSGTIYDSESESESEPELEPELVSVS